MQQDFVKVIRGSECIAWPDLAPPSSSRYELVSFNLLSVFFANDYFLISFEKPDFIRLRMHLNCQNLGNWRGASSWLTSLPLFRMETVSILNKFLRTWIMDEYISPQIREKRINFWKLNSFSIIEQNRNNRRYFSLVTRITWKNWSSFRNLADREEF